TAIKGELATEDDIKNVNDVMLLSNYKASKLLRKYDVSACTDITGFGLGGHLLEMAKGSNRSIIVDVKSINLINNTLEYAKMGIIPAGAYHNKQFSIFDYEYKADDQDLEIVMFDPQTSGGLIISVSSDDAEDLLMDLKDSGYNEAKVIGEVVAKIEKNFLLFK
ncbi:MAG: selenide, water dikinase SelD, partial [Calditerrivibrio sp.]|nr:selenide, water dikinase SelD [Calditerrivibrio sp.]